MSWAIEISEAVKSLGKKKVLAHIGGPSGAGKTELVNTLQPKVRNIRLVDLDQFDDEAVSSLGWTKTPKNDYTDKMLSTLFLDRQKRINQFISSSSKPIVFFGHTIEAGKETRIPTDTRILLSTSPRTASVRRFKTKGLSASELKDLMRAGKEDVIFLKRRGYTPMSSRKIYSLILQWSKELK